MKPSIQPPPVITFRGFVQPSSADHGSLNVQLHVARYGEASWQLLSRLGFGPRRMHTERRGFVALELQITHQEEVRAATVLQIESELLEIGPNTLRCLHRMGDSESQRTLSTMELTIALIGLDDRRTTPLPAELMQRARAIFPTASVRPPAPAARPPLMALLA